MKALVLSVLLFFSAASGVRADSSHPIHPFRCTPMGCIVCPTSVVCF